MAHRDTDTKNWQALGTVAHNRAFTNAELCKQAGRNIRHFLRRLISTGHVEIVDACPARYSPTPLGWERIEVEAEGFEYRHR